MIVMPTLRAKKRKPTCPGAILRDDVLSSLGMTQVEISG